MSQQNIELANSKKREAFTLYENGKLAEAKSLCIQASQLNPADAQIWLLLGNICGETGTVKEAKAAYKQALLLDPDLGEGHQYLGNLLGTQGHHSQAAECYRQALRIKPRSIPAHINLGTALVIQGNIDEAVEIFRNALRIDPDCRKAALGIAHAYERQGDPQRAYAQLLPFLSQGKAGADMAMIFAAICKPLGHCDEAIALMERLLAQEDSSLTNRDRSTLYFRLGRLYDAKNEYDTAFLNFKRGNEIKAQEWSFDVDAHIRLIDALITTFSPDFMSRAPRARSSSQRPVFIVGMPRSGTSLTEQLLASHPSVFGAGELHELTHIVAGIPALLGNRSPYPQCLESLSQAHCEQLSRRYLDKLAALSPKALRVTDKMPDNFLRLGLIALLFPGVRVIHCVRNPLDTCLSAYFQNFGPGLSYTFDLNTLAIYYDQYRRLMNHFMSVLELNLLEVKYEDLVANQEKVTRELLGFCDLEWDERCLHFHETDRVVTTASYDQVRQPLYSRSVGRWQHYTKHLGPLEHLLKKYDI